MKKTIAITEEFVRFTSPTFPPPAEVLAHPQGHLCYSSKPHYGAVKRKDAGKPREIAYWSAQLCCKNETRYFGWGKGATPVAAFEDAMARVAAANIQHGSYTRFQGGLRTVAEDKAIRKLAREKSVAARVKRLADEAKLGKKAA